MPKINPFSPPPNANYNQTEQGEQHFVYVNFKSSLIKFREECRDHLFERAKNIASKKIR